MAASVLPEARRTGAGGAWTGALSAVCGLGIYHAGKCVLQQLLCLGRMAQGRRVQVKHGKVCWLVIDASFAAGLKRKVRRHRSWHHGDS